ncbi:MAG: hypothetical protein ACR2MF_06130 [Chthoniobacterales bacterium]
MHAFHDVEEGIGEPRPHPWAVSAHDPNAKFVDFLKCPDLVRTSLEDFIPYAHRPAVERFFQMVEWMRGPKTIWETTESCFWPPSSPHTNNFFSQYPIICSGRLVFFSRHHLWQCRHSEWAFNNLVAKLGKQQPTPPNACIGVFMFPISFRSLSTNGGQTARECKALGVRCYGFGINEDEAFSGFGLGVDAVQEAAKGIADMLILSGDLKP